MSDKDTEIWHLKQQLASLQGHPVANLDTSVTTEPSVTGIAVGGAD